MHITKAHIIKLINEPYLSRGEKYFQEGMVKITSKTETLVKGKAIGSSVYNVQLSFKNNTLNGKCSCPAFYDFGPCKHMAAIAFAIASGLQNKSYRFNQAYAEELDDFEDIEKSLRRKTKNELIDLIIELNGLYPGIVNDLGIGDDL